MTEPRIISIEAPACDGSEKLNENTALSNSTVIIW
jgi:hypothetical protein